MALPNGLYIFCISGMFWGFVETKKRNKWGIFGVWDLGFVLFQEACAASIHRPPVSQNPCLEAGSGCKESGSELKITFMLDYIYCPASEFYFSPAFILILWFLFLNSIPFHSQMELQWRTQGAATPFMCMLNQYLPIITLYNKQNFVPTSFCTTSCQIWPHTDLSGDFRPGQCWLLDEDGFES